MRGRTSPDDGKLLARRPVLGASTLGIASLLLPAASHAASGDEDTAAVVPLEATGGTIAEVTIGSVTYRVHTFTGSGSFDVTGLGTSDEVEYLIVGGGGAGGHGRHCGGGGAGGVVHNVGATPLTVSVQGYPVVVGAGGARAASSVESALAKDGADSSVFGLTALGGGGGGMHVSGPVGPGRGRDGGSGGGSGHNESPVGAALQPTSASGGFGSDGSLAINRSANGAGGGAGAAGGAPSGAEADAIGAGGDGGVGLQVDIDGNGFFWGGGGGGAGGRQDGIGAWRGGDGGRGGGGGGAVHTDDAGGRAGVGGGIARTAGQDGVKTRTEGACSGGDGGANTGGGGGGASGWGTGVGSGNGLGGAGGSGIVIIRYRIG
jgi:hypothetical protein